jgi:hypothetical protein
MPCVSAVQEGGSVSLVLVVRPFLVVVEEDIGVFWDYMEDRGRLLIIELL